MKTTQKEAEKFADSLDFEKSGGLVSAIAQSEEGEVLMLAFQNKEAVVETLSTGKMHYWSRSRKKLWRKGEESGNEQFLKEYHADCDRDAVLYIVEQKGNACHLDRHNCFDREAHFTINSLWSIIEDRKENPKPGSYTNKLLENPGLARAKIKEECGEVLKAFEEEGENEQVWEACDVIYHLLVLCASKGIALSDLEKELQKRHEEKKP